MLLFTVVGFDRCGSRIEGPNFGGMRNQTWRFPRIETIKLIKLNYRRGSVKRVVDPNQSSRTDYKVLLLLVTSYTAIRWAFHWYRPVCSTLALMHLRQVWRHMHIRLPASTTYTIIKECVAITPALLVSTYYLLFGIRWIKFKKFCFHFF